MSTTLEQKTAKLENRIARLKQRSRQLETGQKVILGALVLADAIGQNRGNGVLDYTIAKLRTVTRPADIKRVKPLLDELLELKAR